MDKMLPVYCQVFLIATAFVGMIFFLWKCRQQLWSQCRGIPPIYIAGTGVVVLAQLGLWTYCFSSFNGPCPMYYIDAARSIFTSSKDFMQLAKGEGWAFLIFLDMLFSGGRDYSGVGLLQILGAGAIAGIFFLSVWAGLSFRTAFLSAVLFAFIPARLIAAAFVETYTPCLFFVIWAAAFSFLFLRQPARDTFFLAVFFWVFAVFVRGETVFLFLFFLLCMWRFVPDQARRSLPWADGLFLAGVLLMPHMAKGARHVFGEHCLLTQPDVGVVNFLHNACYYGWSFLSGRVHPFILTLLALCGAVALYLKDKKAAGVLAGWLAVLSATYFSMWLQIYGESKAFFPKVVVFLYFYPPVLLCAAQGISSGAARLLPGKKALVSILACAVLLGSFLPYFCDFFIETRMIALDRLHKNDIHHFTTKNRFVVGCYRDDDVIDPVKADHFVRHPRERRRIFHLSRMYLVEPYSFKNGVPAESGACQEAIAVVKKEGRAVFVDLVRIGGAFYNLYALSEF